MVSLARVGILSAALSVTIFAPEPGAWAQEPERGQIDLEEIEESFPGEQQDQAPHSEPPQVAGESEQGMARAEPTLGFGYQRTLAAFRGPQVEYRIQEVVLNGMLAFQTDRPDGADRGFGLGFSLGAFYRTLRRGPMMLLLGARVDLAFASEDFLGMDSASAAEFALELPVRFQYWPIEHLAIHWETGIAFASASEDGAVFTNAPPGATSIVIGAAQLLGQAGFVIYW